MLNNTISKCMNNGLKIDNVFDIGACSGSWSTNLQIQLLRNSKFFLFEANPTHLSELIISGMKYFFATLSDEDGKVVDFYNSDTTGDSYYKETTTWYDNKKPTKRQTTTIDAIMELHNLPIPNLLKIDTQGSELDILTGSTKLIGKTELIVCEMPIIEYNRGSPVISDYLKFFSQNDYIPIELVEVHHAENTLLQIDVLFMLRSAKNQFLGESKTIRV